MATKQAVLHAKSTTGIHATMPIQYRYASQFAAMESLPSANSAITKISLDAAHNANLIPSTSAW